MAVTLANLKLPPVYVAGGGLEGPAAAPGSFVKAPDSGK